jgi:hypothetical protein
MGPWLLGACSDPLAELAADGDSGSEAQPNHVCSGANSDGVSGAQPLSAAATPAVDSSLRLVPRMNPPSYVPQACRHQRAVSDNMHAST